MKVQRDDLLAASQEAQTAPATPTVTSEIEELKTAHASEVAKLREEALKLKKVALKMKKESTETKLKLAELEEQHCSEGGGVGTELEKSRAATAAAELELARQKKLLEEESAALSRSDMARTNLDRELATVVELHEADVKALQSRISVLEAEGAKGSNIHGDSAEIQQSNCTQTLEAANVELKKALAVAVAAEAAATAVSEASGAELEEALAALSTASAKKAAADDEIRTLSNKMTTLKAAHEALEAEAAALRAASVGVASKLPDGADLHRRLEAAEAKAVAAVEEKAGADAEASMALSRVEELETKITELVESHRSEAEADKQVTKNAEGTEARVVELKVACAEQITEINQLKEKVEGLEAQCVAAGESAVRVTEAHAAEVVSLETQVKRAGEVETELRAELEQSMVELEERRIALGNTGEECSVLRTQMQKLEVAKARLENQLEQEREALGVAQTELTVASAGASQNQMLDLELADYKRTTETLTSRVGDLESSLKLAQERAAADAKTITELQEAVSRSGDLSAQDHDNRQKLKQLLLKAKKDVTEKRVELEKQQKAYAELEAMVEARVQETESLKTEVAQLTVQLDCANAEQRDRDAEHDIALHTARFELERAQAELTAAQSSVVDTQAEFQKYKARAQSVLKQKESEQSAAPAGQTLDALHNEIAELRTKLEAAVSELSETRDALAEAEAECNELGARIEASSASSAKAMSVLNARIVEQQQQADQMDRDTQEIRSQLQMEHAMLVRSQKEKIKAIAAEALAAQDEKQKTIDGLRKELASAAAAAVVPINQAEHGDESAKKRTNRDGIVGRPAAQAATSEPSSDSKVPGDLGSLLQSPQYSSSTSVGVATRDSKELSVAKQQVLHLTRLLQESEDGLERMDAQTRVLKQELRRHEANAKRADAANLEYLKNVTFKFICQGNDEREALIPVMGMLLHFSQDEIQSAVSGFRKVSAAALAEAANTDTKKPTGWLGLL